MAYDLTSAFGGGSPKPMVPLEAARAISWNSARARTTYYSVNSSGWLAEAPEYGALSNVTLTTSYQTVLSISGAGRLAWLKIPSPWSSPTITYLNTDTRVTIDGKSHVIRNMGKNDLASLIFWDFDYAGNRVNDTELVNEWRINVGTGTQNVYTQIYDGGNYLVLPAASVASGVNFDSSLTVEVKGAYAGNNTASNSSYFAASYILRY